MRTGVMAGPEHKQMSETSRLFIRGSCIHCCCNHRIANRGGGASGGNSVAFGGAEQEGGVYQYSVIKRVTKRCCLSSFNFTAKEVCDNFALGCR